jgi:heparan-alpha-glucosaminide N-acetyltransferase
VRALWGHVILRSASLVVLGLIMANASNVEPSHMAIRGDLWEFIGVLGGSFFLSVYPSKGPTHTWHKVLRIAGIVMVIAMYAIFRRTGRDGQIQWIAGGYRDILGVIGYAYFSVCLLYIPFRPWFIAPLLWFSALVTFNAVTTAPFIAKVGTQSANAAHWLRVLFLFPPDEWPWDNGASASLVMAGVVTTIIFMQAKRFQSFRQKMVPAIAFAFATLVAGYLLKPLGISKIRATPT